MVSKATKHSRVRAKRGYIETKRYDKSGRPVKAQVHNVTGLAGAISAKEMERTMMDIADEHGASYDQIRIETYEHGDAPVETGRDAPLFYATDQYRANWDRAFGK